MATTLTLDTPVQLTLDATAGNALQVNVPADTRYLVFSSWSDDTGGDIKIDISGTDGGALGTGYERYQANTAHSRRMYGSGGQSQRTLATIAVYVAGTVNSQLVQMTAASEAP